MPRSRRWRATASGAQRCGCSGACAPALPRAAAAPRTTPCTGAALFGSTRRQGGQASRRRRAGRGRGAARMLGGAPGGPSPGAPWALTRPRTTYRTRWPRPSARATSSGSRRALFCSCPVLPIPYSFRLAQGISGDSQCANGSRLCMPAGAGASEWLSWCAHSCSVSARANILKDEWRCCAGAGPAPRSGGGRA